MKQKQPGAASGRQASDSPFPTHTDGNARRGAGTYEVIMALKISTAFPSNYLKCADLGGQPRIVTVRACVMEELGQGKDKEKKPVLYFEKGPKGLVLNKTNAKTIVKAYGDDTTGWTGELIEIYPTRVPFGDEEVDAIRVRVSDVEPSAATAAVPPAALPPVAEAAPMVDAELNDDLKDLPWA